MKKIGLIDSGLGGLTVLRKLVAVFPAQYIYFADTKNLPYGDKSNDQLIRIAFQAVDILLEHKVDAIIIACHTLSAVALPALKNQYPPMTFIGMIESVVHRACQTKTGSIGIMATSATIKTSAHKKALLQLNPSLTIVEQACPALVPAIEHVPIDIHHIDTLLDEYLKPFCERKVGTLILGCTHYALIKESITKKFDNTLRLVSSDEEIEHVFEALNISKNSCASTVSFLVSGDKEEFFTKLPRYFF